MRKQPSIFTAADELAQVLGPDLAQHFLDHRKALKKPMTAYAGKLMADKLRGFPDPVAAVQQSILKGWQDVFPVAAPTQHNPLGGKPTFDDLARYYDAQSEREGADSAAAFPLLQDLHKRPVH